MSLSNSQKKFFRSIGHKLNPVITIAENGLSETVSLELERALEDHELIKVKLKVGDSKARKNVIDEMCSIFHAQLVQSIGHTALIYRPAKNTNPKLSNLLRNSSESG